jgi:hypothetical protein
MPVYIPTMVTIPLHHRARYRTTRHIAASRDETISSIMTAALCLCLDEYEVVSDRAAVAATEGEPTYDGEQAKAEQQGVRRPDSTTSRRKPNSRALADASMLRPPATKRWAPCRSRPPLCC